MSTSNYILGVDLANNQDDSLCHIGRSKLDGAPGPGSGRYPLGSGEDPNQHRGDFISRVKELRKSGMKEIDIAKATGYETTGAFRAAYSNARNEARSNQIRSARAMLADGKSQAETARALGINESTLRSLLNERSQARTNAARETANRLRELVDEKGMIDVGTGVELELRISREKLRQALEILKDEGYPNYGGGVPQVTNPGKQTNIKVLCPPGTEHKEIYNYENVHTITDYKQRFDEDGSEHFERGFEYPASLDSKRLLIRYRDDVAPDGHTGVEKDGTIEIRPGVKDLDLGESTYAQVRILVDGNKYLKGMAFYSDDIPDGVDVVFNTNKGRDQEGKVLKDIKPDPTNPFGSLVLEDGGQYHYTDENGERKLGLINKTRKEGQWNDWNKALPSQFLSKQSMKLIKSQLQLSIAEKKAEYEEILALTNLTVKKHMLEEFANECDAAAVDLQAAALPRQRYQVILPISTMKENEVYAPNFEDGETVALVRYPHGGTFEIPILTVNNKHPDARRILGPTAADAIGINSKVAERLSGADFDGDTVMVIPCNSARSKVKIVSTDPLEGLKGFDPTMEYGPSHTATAPDGSTRYYRDGHEYKIMRNTQMEMGKISNLITDMTLKGANEADIAKAVRHSMVVIDAAKHKLDWKASEIDNNIAALKRTWQAHIGDDGKVHYGASTLISRAKSPISVLKRKGSPTIDPETGELKYKSVVETYTDPKTGKVKTRMQDSTQMAEAKDAHKLSSGTPQESAYADYANYMKALANSARKEYLATPRLAYSAKARNKYREEVNGLLAQLNISLKNAPRERQAQLATNSEVRAMKKNNPDMSPEDIKKKGQQALSRNRIRFGAERRPIKISPRAWEAIQAGAISDTALRQILRFADSDQVKSYATPRSFTTLTAAKQARVKHMKDMGYTTNQIAAAVGVSTSTVSRFINGKE